MEYTHERLAALHRLSGLATRHAIRGDRQRAGCFHCGQIYASTEIYEFCLASPASRNEDCPLCPRCGIDAVLIEGVMEGEALTEALLQAMRRQYFEDEDD